VAKRLPRPEEAPVTIAVRPSSRNASVGSCSVGLPRRPDQVIALIGSSLSVVAGFPGPLPAPRRAHDPAAVEATDPRPQSRINSRMMRMITPPIPMYIASLPGFRDCLVAIDLVPSLPGWRVAKRRRTND
jgi:hypothetical protein